VSTKDLRWNRPDLERLVGELLAEHGVPFDLAIVRPTELLQPRIRHYALAMPQFGGEETTWGHEALSEFTSIIVIVAYTDVAVDYHLVADVVPNLRKRINARFRTAACEYDNYMVARKEMAALARLGRIGRNGLFFSRRFGFNCKIDLLPTHIQFDETVDASDQFHRLAACATCRLCVDACPVSAFDDFRLSDPMACEKQITPDWETPDRMCRACITSCPLSNTLLDRVQAAGAPRKVRLTGPSASNGVSRVGTER
jgi:ferredoxin